MINRHSSISILKKVIQDNKTPSAIDKMSNYDRVISKHHHQKQSKLKEQSKHKQTNSKIQNTQQDYQDSDEELKLQSNVFKEIDCLYIESKIQVNDLTDLKQNNKNYNQSNEQNYNRSKEVYELPLECLQSKIKGQKLKVHSSIDGMQTSSNKQISSRNQQNLKPHQVTKQQISKQQRLKQSLSRQQRSIPLSDLILSDNNYLKLSGALNTHQVYAQSSESLSLKNFQNIKLLKQQTLQKLQLVDSLIQLHDHDQLINSMQDKITQLQSDIYKIKLSGISSKKSRSKTPETKRVRSFRNYFKGADGWVNQEQDLKIKIENQREKVMRDQKKSVSIDQKLSKAKSNFKKIERRLNDWEEELGLKSQSNKIEGKQTKLSNRQSNVDSLCRLVISPKSASNITKVSKVSSNSKVSSSKQQQTLPYNKNGPQVQFDPLSRCPDLIKYKTKPKLQSEQLQKSRANYFSTLKRHLTVIFKQIETYKQYEANRSEEIQEQIELLRKEIKYVGRIIKSRQSEEKGNKGVEWNNKRVEVSNVLKVENYSMNKNFHNINSENIITSCPNKLISTCSNNSQPMMGIPPLSPRTPKLHGNSPQLISNSSSYEIYSKSPYSNKLYEKYSSHHQLCLTTTASKNKSPSDNQMYSRSPLMCSPRSINSRSSVNSRGMRHNQSQKVLQLKDINSNLSAKSTNYSSSKINTARIKIDPSSYRHIERYVDRNTGKSIDRNTYHNMKDKSDRIQFEDFSGKIITEIKKQDNLNNNNNSQLNNHKQKHIKQKYTQSNQQNISKNTIQPKIRKQHKLTSNSNVNSNKVEIGIR